MQSGHMRIHITTHNDFNIDYNDTPGNFISQLAQRLQGLWASAIYQLKCPSHFSTEIHYTPMSDQP